MTLLSKKAGCPYLFDKGGYPYYVLLLLPLILRLAVNAVNGRLTRLAICNMGGPLGIWACDGLWTCGLVMALAMVIYAS